MAFSVLQVVNHLSVNKDLINRVLLNITICFQLWFRFEIELYFKISVQCPRLL